LAIAKKAIERKTGARGLRSIMESMLLDTMYEIPDMDEVEEVIINEKTVLENEKPVYVLSDSKKKRKKSKDKADDNEAEAESA